MKVKVSDIGENGLHVLTLRGSDWLNGIVDSDAGGPKMSVASRVNFNLRFSKVLKDISVKGDLEFTVESPCSRCLTTVRTRLSPQVNLTLSPAYDSNDKEEDEGAHHETYNNEEVDLEGYLRQLAAMSLPIKVLCREKCRGLCASCGADLNFDECSCEGQWVNPSFLVLKNLKV